jgi:hypothetical protein
MKREGTVEIDEQSYILSGHTYCFRSREAALRESRRSTTNPDVTILHRGDDIYYLAEGDEWINDKGQRGCHRYGIGGRYINLVI